MQVKIYLRFLLFALLVPVTLHSQNPDPIQYSPGGLLDNVYDHYGNHYTLDDIKIPATTPGGTEARWIDTSCDTGIFRLHYTTGSGFINGEHPDAADRRAVVCKVFKDLSDFIVSPLHNAGNTQKVEIWVRKISDMMTEPPSTSQVGGIASCFYTIPAGLTYTNGGITDNEAWKTIQAGVNSYNGIVFPLISTGGLDPNSGNYYHGQMAINFSNPDTIWNLNLSRASFTWESDLYTVVLHEVLHALGFQSLIDENGNSKFGATYKYYNRYDRFLKNYDNNNFIISTNSLLSPMYDYTFNSNALSTSILHPGCTVTPPTSSGHQNIINCGTTINFTGTFYTVPTYTPDCFEKPSSFSHFNDQCYTPSNPNDHFVMNSGHSSTLRTISNEERSALCDIGYNTTNTFGTAANLNYIIPRY